jgi:hypothetical protein
MHVFHSTVPQTRFLAKLHDERPAIEEDSYGASSCGKWVQSTKGETAQTGSRLHVGTGIKYEDIQTLNLKCANCMLASSLGTQWGEVHACPLRLHRTS